jgi:hypothetical protein
LNITVDAYIFSKSKETRDLEAYAIDNIGVAHKKIAEKYALKKESNP